MLRRGCALAAAATADVAAPILHAGARHVSASSRLEAPLAATRVLLQQKKKPAAGGAAAAAPEEKYDLKTQIPVNLLKDGGEPEYKPDDQYPPWLFKLLEDKPILEDYVMKGLENVPEGDMKRVFRLANKRRIKEYNTAHRKE